MANISKTVDMTTAVGNTHGDIHFTSKDIAPNADFRDMLGCHVTMQEPVGWVAYCAKTVDDKGVWHFRARCLQQGGEDGVRQIPKGTQVDVLITLYGQTGK